MTTEPRETETPDLRDYRRPDPIRWLWYAYGGSLPPRYNTWVLHDLTGPTWWLRHFGRSLLQVAPVVVVLLLVLPGNPAIQVAAVTAGVLLGLLYSGAYINEITEYRVSKAGYPVGTARQVREEADHDRHHADAEQYERTWRNN
ncbi:MAG TPA: DUF5313 family protein [Pseudonocardia sp.]